MTSPEKTWTFLWASAVGASGLVCATTLMLSNGDAAPRAHASGERAALAQAVTVQHARARDSLSGQGRHVEPAPARDTSVPELAAQQPAPGLPQRETAELALARGPYVGVLLPEQSADVTAPQAGLITALHVALGELVEQGQKLASLSLEQARLEYARAEAERDAAQAALGRARIEQAHAREQAERSQALAREGLTTQEELAQQLFRRDETRVRTAEAASLVRERSAHAQQLRVLRDQAEVTAAFRGRVAERYVSEGTKVAAGAPLFRLISEDAVLLRFGVGEDVVALQVGNLVTVVPDAHPDLGFAARVVRVSPELDAASRMRTVEATPLQPQTIVEQGLLGALVQVWPTSDVPPAPAAVSSSGALAPEAVLPAAAALPLLAARRSGGQP